MEGINNTYYNARHYVDIEGGERQNVQGLGGRGRKGQELRWCPEENRAE